MDEKLLQSKKIGELKELAKAAGIPASYKLKKEELIAQLLALAEAEEPPKQPEKHSPRNQEGVQEQNDRPQPERQDREEVDGVLEVAEGGYGFLRFHNYLTSDKDIYVSQTQIRRFHLKTGDRIFGTK